MFKWPGKRDETKKQKSKQLWGRDFNIVESGLDEAQVVSFVDDLVKRNDASSPASVRSVLKRAIADAEQIVASIKMRAETEAEEEAARMVAKANQEVESIKGRTETIVEKEAEDILAVANREAEMTEPEAKQEVLPEASEKIEESSQPQEEPVGEVEESAQSQEEPVGEVEEPAQSQEELVGEVEEAASSELVEEKPLVTLSPEERQETKPDLLKEEGHRLYTGEVELAVGNPVDPKMVTKLYTYLQTTPEIKFVRTSGSWDRGTTITVVLDKPIALVSVLSSKIPEASVMAERPEKDGFVKGRRGVRRISLVLKEV